MRQLSLLVLLVLILALTGCYFANTGSNYYNAPGFFLGIWHGLLAPWSLILKIFLDIGIYAVPNSGWFYDFGFLIGILGSIHIGWIAAIIALVFYIFL